MWTVLNLSQDFLLYHSMRERGNITFIVTDLKMIWHKTYADGDFFTKFIEDNASLRGGDTATILSMVLEQMEQDTKAMTKKVDWDKNLASLRCTFKGIGSITLKVNLQLEPGSAEMFYEFVTLKLLTTITEMRKIQNELQSVIEKKDIEIEEYKNLGASLNIKYLITDKFDQVKYHSKYQEYDKNIKSFEEILQKEIEKSHNNIKRRKTIDDQKSHSSDSSKTNSEQIKLQNRDLESSSGFQTLSIPKPDTQIKEENKQDFRKEAIRPKIKKRQINF